MASFTAWLDLHPLLWPVFIFTARIIDVSMGTVRTILVVRGSRVLAPMIGFVEISVWLLAISGVLTHLDRWYNLVAYAGGFAAGNAIGVFIEQALAIGMQALTLVSSSKSAAVAAGLRLAGYGVTEMKGRGLNGEVSLSLVIVNRRETRSAIKVARVIDPDVFCTVEDIRASSAQMQRAATAATGWRSILKKK